MLDPQTTPLPVSIEVTAADLLDGISEIDGSLTIEGNDILFRYHTLSLLRKASSLMERRISLSDLQRIEYRSRFVTARVTLYPRYFTAMKDMPGASDDKIIFHIKRADRDHAEAFVAVVKGKLYGSLESEMDSVPFGVSDTEMGLQENFGLLYLDDEFLVFDLKSGLSGFVKPSGQVVKIEPAALEAVRFKRGKLKDTISIRPKKADLLSAIPGRYELEVKLKIAKRHRATAERLVARIENRVLRARQIHEHRTIAENASERT